MNIKEYLNSFTDAELAKFFELTSSDIMVTRNINSKINDTSWMDMVEECIPYLDNIIRNPRRFIVQEENIVPIEKTKVVTEEAIRHLAQNTGLIQEINEDGNVIPLKLLNVYREETEDIYENRFIKSLIDNLCVFVEDKLNTSDQKSFSKIDNVVTYNALLKNKNNQVKVNLNFQSYSEENLDTEKDGHSIDERIAHIKDVISTYRQSKFIKGLKESNPVRSPIRKTNVILKEPNFQKALELWEYLEQNNIKPFTEIKRTSETIKDEDIKAKFDTAFFIENEAITTNKTVEKEKYNSAVISKLVNDFIMSGDITEKEFKSLINKEFKEAKKHKEKLVADVRDTFDKFINEYDKRKKKAYALLK